jgi:hypothetical protein
MADNKEVRSDEAHFDEYEHYNYDQEKYLKAGQSGKQRTKKEAAEHTNHFDPSGHSRKITTKMENTEKNQKAKAGTSPPSKSQENNETAEEQQ